MSNRSFSPDEGFITSFDDINTSDPPRYEDVYVPEFGKTADGSPKKIRVSAMNEFERRRFVGLGQIPDPANPGVVIRDTEYFESGRYDIELLWWSCRKSDGSELLSRAEWATLMEKKKDPAPFVRLNAAALRVNVLDDETFQEVRKNLPPPRAKEITDSLSPSMSEVPA